MSLPPANLPPPHTTRAPVLSTISARGGNVLPASPPAGVFAPARPLPAPTTAATQRAVSRRGGWTTPRFLRALLALGGLMAFALVVTGFVGVREMRRSLATVGHAAAPNVINAQLIRATLSELDENAASDLLAAPRGSRAARDAYDGNLVFLNHRLIDAAQHITLGEAERGPVNTISDNLVKYQEAVTRARVASAQSSANGAYIFQQATALLHGEMLPAADALIEANARTLERAYREHADGATVAGVLTLPIGTAAITVALIVLLGVLLLAVLLAAQVFLVRRTRRVVNLPLLAATALTAALLFNLVGATLAEGRSLRAAKVGAYDSLNVLWRAYAAATDARGDESLALLDPGTAANYEAAYAAKMRSIADRPIDAPLVSAAASGRATFNGYLADELRNVTSATERDAVLETLRAFGRYQAVHDRIRALEGGGKHADAVALSTGTQPEQAHRLFDEFTQALSYTIYINDAAFNQNIAGSEAALRYGDILTVVAGAAVAGLLWLGIQLRLREYAT